MWISFSKPEYLLLLPPVVWLLWRLARGSFADLRGRRRRLAWGTRIALVVCLIGALAGAQLVRRSRDNVVVFALDASYSVPEAERTRGLEFIKESLKHRRSHDRAALVVFGREAAVESENLAAPESVQVASAPGQSHTDLASALRLGLGLLSPGASGKIVLLSDGNENVGSAAQETLLAQASKVPVDVVPLQTRSARDVVVKEVSVPADARRDEPFPLRVTFDSTQPMDTVVTVLADGKPIVRRPVTLAAGRTTQRIPIALKEPGLDKVEVLVEAKSDALPENNRGAGFVRVKDKPRLLVVAGRPDDAASLSASLRLQGVTVDIGSGIQLPTSAADLDRYDGVLLANYPAYGMTERQLVMFRDATRDLGVGLGMVGGEFSFGAGGYYRSPVEEALPVSMELKKSRVFPAAAVMVVMDTSGSMGEIEDGVEKIQLAAEAGTTTVDLLQPYDRIGFIASDPQPTLICPLQDVGSKTKAKSDIRSMRAGGGGIYVYPTLSAAYDLMRKDKSPVRHVIILADGSDCDEPGNSVALAQAMAAEKITVSTIAFGGGKDVPFLKAVAKGGRGNFYLTERARDLKKIFTRETLTIAKPVLVEETFRPKVADLTDAVSGVDWASVPPLLGYVGTSPKSLARVPLVSHKDDPIFAHWQYGLGRSIAFTSDAKAHWAAHWLGWSEFSRFWSQSVRWSLRQQESGLLHPRVEQAGDKAHVVVEATTDQGAYIDGLDLSAHVNQPDGGRAEVPLTQTGPGKYEGTLPAPASGSYVVGLSASGPGGFQATQTFGFAVSYPPDLADTKPNHAFLESLAEQTGGGVLKDPARTFTPPKTTPPAPTDIWRGLLWLAAVLLPVDVALRRLVIAQEDLEPFRVLVRAARAKLGAPFARLRAPRAQPEREVTGRLLERKRSLQPRLGAGEEAEPPESLAPRPVTPPPVVPPATPAPRPEPEPVAARPAARRDEPSDGSTAAHLLRRKRERR